MCADAFFLHNLQPLTAATADVKRFGLRILLPQRLQERAVDSQAALNFFYWRTEALFQCSIKVSLMVLCTLQVRAKPRHTGEFGVGLVDDFKHDGALLPGVVAVDVTVSAVQG